MLDSLLLLSGNDIPFVKANLTIHNPTLKEIGYVGEENFLNGYQLLNVSKNFLPEQDKVNLDVISNFDILIAILRERNAVMQRNRNCVEMVLALIFPWYTIDITSDAIVLEKEEERHLINNDNFETFKTIFNMMFSFSKDESRDYNPSGEVAKRIAEKLKQRHQKLAELKEGKQKIDILSRYVSILAVGEHKDMNSLLNLSVYQLFDEFERFKLKMS